MSENKLAKTFQISYTTLKRLRDQGYLDGTFTKTSYKTVERINYDGDKAIPILKQLLRR